MNKSYSKIRHIQESNRILETRLIVENNKYDLLNEQSDVWTDVKPEGTDPLSPKHLTSTIPASNLIYSGKQVYANGGVIKNNKLEGVRIDLKVGAEINSYYTEKMQLKNIPDSTVNFGYTAGRFNCRIDINLFGPPIIGKAEILTIIMKQQKNGKFLVYAQGGISSNEEFKKKYPGFYILNDTNKPEFPQDLAANKISYMVMNNLSFITDDTFKKINTELDRLGFPSLPNSVNSTEKQIVI